MADGHAVDVSDDCCEMTLEESIQAHSALMAETRANAESAHSIVRHSGARKFNQEDPIEAAAAEMILKTNV
jgi:hypothetical protein